MQGKYNVTPGANPGSHMWLLCNPGIPRRTPFVVDLGGSELVFQVSFSVPPDSTSSGSSLQSYTQGKNAPCAASRGVVFSQTLLLVVLLLPAVFLWESDFNLH